MNKTITAVLISLFILIGIPALSFGAYGGPDAYGNYYVDSNDPSGPSYSMIDISDTGTLTVACDDCSGGPYPIGFTFPFYGNWYTQFYAQSNGGITFSNYYLTLGNGTIPAADGYNNLIVAVWDDIQTGLYVGQGVYYQYFADCPHPDFGGECLVVMWKDANHYYNYGTFDFEIILFPDGDILMQFGPGNPELGSGSTTGIENIDGTIGLQYAKDTFGSLSDNLAIYFGGGFVPPAPTEEQDELDWDEQWKITYGLEDEYDKLPSYELYEKGEDKILGIECFITAAGQSNVLFPLMLAALTAGGIIIRKRMSR